VLFGKTVMARHLKLRVLSGFGNDLACSLAELAVLRAEADDRDLSVASGPYRDVKTATEEIEGP